MSPGAWVFGPEFTAENLPRTAAILHQATHQNRPLKEAAKVRIQRPRPKRRDPAGTPCLKKHPTDSYPSGHSTGAALWSAFYAAAMPEYQPLFENYVREAMWCRVLAGMHFPSDTQAGRLLGRLSAAEMLKNPAARAAAAEIRAEILSFLKTRPECAPAPSVPQVPSLP
jgi:acid phosphatase (class A)